MSERVYVEKKSAFTYEKADHISERYRKTLLSGAHTALFKLGPPYPINNEKGMIASGAKIQNLYTI